ILLGERARELALLNKAELDQGITDPMTILTGVLKRHRELLGGDQAFPDQKFTDPVGCCCRRSRHRYPGSHPRALARPRGCVGEGKKLPTNSGTVKQKCVVTTGYEMFMVRL